MNDKERSTEMKIATIRDTVSRCQREGIGVTEYGLRRWIKEGRLKVLWSGNRALVNWDNLMEFVSGGIQ